MDGTLQVVGNAMGMLPRDKLLEVGYCEVPWDLNP
jgi:hypothetical protein